MVGAVLAYPFISIISIISFRETTFSLGFPFALPLSTSTLSILSQSENDVGLTGNQEGKIIE